MYLITVKLVRARPATSAECADLRACLSAAGSGRTVEYAYAQPSAAGMDLVLFVPASGLLVAENRAHGAVTEVLDQAAGGFVLGFCGVDLFLPAAEAGLPRDP